MCLKHSITLTICLISIISCADISNNSFQKVNYQGEGDTKSLTLPENALPTTFCLKTARFNGKDYLYYYNQPMYQILVYELDSQRLIDVVQMNEDGPHGIVGFKGFTVLERDKIMISSINRKLYSINLKGEVVNVIDYSQLRDGNEFSRAVTLSHRGNDIYQFGNKYIIPQEPPYRNESKVLISNASKVGTSIYISVEDTTQIFSEQKLTADVVDGNPEHTTLQMTSTSENGTLYWSYIETMNIYYTNINGSGEIKMLEVPFPGEINQVDPQGLGLFRFYAETTLCGRLIFDPYREKFYRMVRYGVKNPDEWYGQDIEYLTRYPVKFYIFVFDRDLKPEKEVCFKGTNYVFNQFFIASDGFYLSLNNPENPEFDEDFLRFERIEL